MLSEQPGGGWSSPDQADSVSRAYLLHATELHRFAAARGGVLGPEDVVQEAFLRLSLEADAGRFPRQPRAWLYRVAMNLIVSAARRRATAEARSLWTTAAEPVDLDTPERQCLAAERQQHVGSAMASVSPRARTGLLMAADGYSGREIALAIGRSETATRAMLSRARRTVRASLAPLEAA